MAEQDRWAGSASRRVGRIGEAGSCRSVRRTDGPVEPARRGDLRRRGSVGLKGAE